MKTIFISSFHPYISRNILSTEAFSALLADPDLRVVLFVPSYKISYFRRMFAYPNLVVEGVLFPPASKDRRGLLFKRLAKYALPSDSVRIERYLKWRRDNRSFYFILLYMLGVLGRFSFFRDALRALDYYLSVRDRYAFYFKKYRPDCVWVTDSQNERDVELAQNARRFGAPVIGMVRSWDNLTLHGFLRFVPQFLLVTSPELAREASELHGIPAERVAAAGGPHYDKYQQDPQMTREKFFLKWNLDPSRPLILFTPIGDNYIPKNDTDPFLLELLEAQKVNILVRFSPTVPVRNLDNIRSSFGLAIDRPGVSFRPDEIRDQEMSPENESNLISELFWCDLVVCGPSTIALDAIFFDKPVILAGAFHPRPRKWWEGAHRYQYSHFKKVLECRAAALPRDVSEFKLVSEAYLKNPSRDQEGRKCVRKMYISFGGGQAGIRLANEIRKFLAGA